jgi:hypothetical protein
MKRVSAATRAEHALVALQDSLGPRGRVGDLRHVLRRWRDQQRAEALAAGQATHQAEYADRCLLALRTELADVGIAWSVAPRLPIDGLTRFVDVWFDNTSTDFSVPRDEGRTGKRRPGAARRFRGVGSVAAARRRRPSASGPDRGTKRLAVLAG